VIGVIGISSGQVVSKMTNLEKEFYMLTMAGKYLVYLEKSGLIITNPAGIRFDLTREDAMELAALISNWQQAMEMGPYEKESEEEKSGRTS
jgi:hypothetical protein